MKISISFKNAIVCKCLEIISKLFFKKNSIFVWFTFKIAHFIFCFCKEPTKVFLEVANTSMQIRTLKSEGEKGPMRATVGYRSVSLTCK
jgi:hypothetical protein